MSDFGNYSNPVAAKIHVCEWCAGEINRGEKHVQFKGMFEGDWQNWRMHNECKAVAEADDSLNEGFAFGAGEMPEAVKARQKGTSCSSHTQSGARREGETIMKRKWFKCNECVKGNHAECIMPKACGCKCEGKQ
jgi:hypothetical protein